MNFEHSDKVKALMGRVSAFMDEHIYPNEERYWKELKAQGDKWGPVPVLEEKKKIAKADGLWNLFLPESHRGAGLTNLEYSPICEIMGRVHWAAYPTHVLGRKDCNGPFGTARTRVRPCCIPKASVRRAVAQDYSPLPGSHPAKLPALNSR